MTEPLLRDVAILIPVVVAWVVIVVDIARRRGLSRRRRIGWLVFVTFVPLAMLLWLLRRPVDVAAQLTAPPPAPDDPRTRLVDLVEAYDAGGLDRGAFERRLGDLLPRTTTG